MMTSYTVFGLITIALYNSCQGVLELAHVHTETLVVIDIYYGIQLTNKTNIENDI